MDRSDESLAGKLQALLPHLDERQRRLLLGAEARVLGHGGIRRVARAAGVAEGTVSRGGGELEGGGGPPGPAAPGGGGPQRAGGPGPRAAPAPAGLGAPGGRRGSDGAPRGADQ